MADRERARRRSQADSGLFRMTYFDVDWNELEHLRAENLHPFNVMDNTERWLFERDLLRVGALQSSPLTDAIFICVEEMNRGS
jgi:hypothetical protein